MGPNFSGWQVFWKNIENSSQICQFCLTWISFNPNCLIFNNRGDSGSTSEVKFDFCHLKYKSSNYFVYYFRFKSIPNTWLLFVDKCLHVMKFFLVFFLWDLWECTWLNFKKIITTSFYNWSKWLRYAWSINNIVNLSLFLFQSYIFRKEKVVVTQAFCFFILSLRTFLQNIIFCRGSTKSKSICNWQKCLPPYENLP